MPESALSWWSHHQAGTAFKQAHVPIREALDACKWMSQSRYGVFHLRDRPQRIEPSFSERPAHEGYALPSAGGGRGIEQCSPERRFEDGKSLGAVRPSSRPSHTLSAVRHAH